MLSSAAGGSHGQYHIGFTHPACLPASMPSPETCCVLVCRTTMLLHAGAQPPEAFREAIQLALKEAGSSSSGSDSGGAANGGACTPEGCP